MKIYLFCRKINYVNCFHSSIQSNNMTRNEFLHFNFSRLSDFQMQVVGLYFNVNVLNSNFNLKYNNISYV